MKVADFVDASGCWKWLELNNMFSTEVKEYIAACHLPNDAFGEDVCFWQATDNGKFTDKSAYNSIVKNDSLHNLNGWKEIWGNFCLLELSIFYG
ncbi:hypothetical protein ERO13_A08G183850v2 [Gossypium hirsutum]|uniref:Uncharacterized protein n=1 Tax=Gossypium barbadense TaxID=3634 RepID=A0A5J5UU90_GOSBA|nr:hypothetical protein ES319_A08G194500v1 [Gossypium barbadense]KAG4188724.1 hypothetical protein ERO13_A08G183850v2 [Gossypium hirsutum]